MYRRVFSLLLCLVLCLSAFPAWAFATEGAAPAEPAEELPEEIIPEEEPIVEEPPALEPIVEEPPAEEPITEEPPAEEPITEEPITEEPPAEEPPAEEPVVEELPAAAVEVTFECAETEDLSALTVYDAEGSVVLPAADADTGEALYGRYALLPGEYRYSFSAAGFEPLENVPFTVTDANLTVTVILTVLSEEEEPEAFMMLTALQGGEPEEVHAITYSELQELLGEDAGVSLSALLSALDLSVEMAEVTAVEASDAAVFTVAKDAEGDDWALTVLQVPAPQASISVTVGGVEHKIVVTNDVDGLDTKTVEYIDANGNTQKATCSVIYDGYNSAIGSGWWTVDGNVCYRSNIDIYGDVHLVLQDGCLFHYKYGNCHLTFQEGAKLTVYGQTSGTGKFEPIIRNSGNATLTVNGGSITASGLEFAQTVVNRGKVSTGTISGNSLVVANGGVVTAERVPKNVTLNNGSLTVTAEFSVDNVTVDGNSVLDVPYIHANNDVEINGGEVILKSSIYGKTVTITGGSVEAHGGDVAAGIGCAEDGKIEISGGTVTAYGAFSAAGIGSGRGGTCGSIMISGGIVTATGGDSGPGIGSGGYGGTCGDIEISGGTVTATGGKEGAGIGGGYRSSTWGIIHISGGTVTAKGTGNGGAGIGAGNYGSGGTVYISGGIVVATGSSGGAGIGGSKGGAGGTITITGGTVTATSTRVGIGCDGSNPGELHVIDDLALCAGESHEAAHITTAEEYRKTRDKFVCIDIKIPYTVSHQLQTVDGTGYEQIEQESLYGIAGFPTEAKQKSYEGFTFAGVTQLPVAKDVIVPIKYNRNLYDIVFDNQGIGTAPEKLTARFGAEVKVDPGAMEAAGYVFNGWFEDEACTKQFTVPQTVTMPLNGFTLYAGWTARTDTKYKVEHRQQKADGTGYDLAETITMTGTSGQQTAAEAKDYPGFTAEEFEQKPIRGDGSTVIEIKYSRNSYTLTFSANGHGTAPAAITALYGAPVAKPADPEATGYTFGGWFEDAACTKAFTFTVMPLGGKTLYAKWTANVYNVTFDGNFAGSTYSKVIKQTYGTIYIQPEDDPERAGYNFTGWFTDPARGMPIYDDDDFLLTEDQTLYAHWRQAPHAYGPASYTWEGDSCTASRTCTKCPEPHTQTETVKGFYTEDTPATCLTASKGHYRAIFANPAFAEQNTAANSVTKGEPLGHSYGDAAYTWDDNKCTATRKCIRCDLSESETATGSYVKDTDATCLAAETGHYKATFTNAAFAEQSTARGSVTRGKELGHSYGDAFYAWNEDKCTATHICTRCEASESETATGSYVKDTDATCLTAETGHYKATFTNAAFAGQSTEKGSVTKGDPLGHSYGAASYTWNNDECTAEHKCTRCDVTESETVKGTYAKDTDATCTEAEKGHYTATFTNTAFETQSTPVTVGEPLGHIFPDTWQQFGAQQHMHQCTREGCRIYDFEDHTFSGDICTKCGYVKKTLQISVSGRPYCDGASSAVDLTFTLNGETCAVTYPEGLNWREFDPTVDYLTAVDAPDAGAKLEAGKTYVTQFLVQVPFKSLPLGSTAVPEIASDFFTVGCTEPIPVAEASCYEMRLTLIFTLTHASLQEAHGQAATCTQDGWKDCWHCTACNKYYEDAACQTLINDYETWKTGAGIIPAGHSYGAASYTWDDDQCKATHTCTRCPEGTEGRIESETVKGFYVEDTPATCLTASRGHYRAIFANAAFAEQNTAKDSVTSGEPLSHSYGTASYSWNADKCTATHTCTRCAEGTEGHTETETVTGSYVKDTDATCNAAETGHYKAAFTNTAFAGQSTARGSVMKGDPLGHSYGDPFYAWNEDQCTATHTCTRCAEGTEGHTQAETATGVYTKEADATCTEAEKGHYTATFINTSFEPQRTPVTVGEPLGHAFPDTWQPYSAQQHMRQCTREGCQAYDYEDHSFHGNTCTVCGYQKSDRYLIILGANGTWTQRSGNALPFTSNAPFDRFVSVKVDGNDIPESCYTAEEGSTKVNLLPAYLETLSLGQHSLDIVSSDGEASTAFTVKAAPVYCTVSFNMCGHGAQVADQFVEMGTAAARPADPSESGYTFTGWYVNAAYTAKYDFSAPVTGDTVLYARWVKGSFPKTGDDSGIALWAVMFSASGIALAGGATLRKKKTKT